MRTAIYLRISYDPSGDSAGVDRQRADCRRLADALGWTVAEVFEDNDASAYGGKTRPGYEALLKAMTSGAVDAVIAWHTDRLHRSMKDLVRFIDAAKQGSVAIRTVQGGDLDLSTASGVMLAQILGAVAEQESAHHAERRRRANDERAAAGTWRNQGKVPFGYTKTGEPVLAEAASLRKGLAGALAGVSLRQIARDWNAAGHVTRTSGGKFNSTMVKRILSNPRYAGLVVHRGKIIGQGQWEPILDRDDQLAFIAMASDPSRNHVATGFERLYQGTGVYRCGVCGGPTKVHNAGSRKSYVCKESMHVRRNQRRLDSYIDRIMAAWIERQALSAEHEDDELPRLVTARDGITARQDQLAESFARGMVTISQMERATADLEAQLVGIDQQIAQRRAGSAIVSSEGGDPFETWTSLSPDIRSKILAETMDVRILPARQGPGFDPESVVIEWKV